MDNRIKEAAKKNATFELMQLEGNILNNVLADLTYVATFEAGAKAMLDLVLDELRSEKAVHGFVENGKELDLGEQHRGPTLMAANLWATWLELRFKGEG